MPSTWSNCKWADLGVLEYGKALRDYQKSTAGVVRVYGTNGPIGWTSEALGQGPAVVIGRKGAYRGVHYSPGPFWVIDTGFWLRPLKAMNPRWAYYQLLTQDINGRDSGSAIPSLSRQDFYSMPVQVPSPGEQDAIASVLGGLDDKIIANRAVTKLCDDAWLAAASQLFEEATGSHELVPLTKLASFINGRAFTKGATGDGRMVIRIAELNSGPGESTVYNDIDVPKEHLAYPGELLFAWSGSLTVKRWSRPEAIVNQHIFKVVPAKGVPVWLVHAHLLRLLEGFRSIAADKATTMGHIQRRHLEVAVARPEGDAFTQADRRCDALWRRALAAEKETLVLEALRDTLLRPLVSGELRVRDAEALVTGVI